MGRIAYLLLACLAGSVTSIVRFACSDNGVGCPGSDAVLKVDPGVFVHFACFLDSNSGLTWNIPSVDPLSFAGSDLVGTRVNVDDLYFSILTSKNGGLASILSFVSVNDTTVTCEVFGDSSKNATQLLIIEGPPQVSVSFSYENPDEAIFMWNEVPNYTILRYEVYLSVDGSPQETITTTATFKTVEISESKTFSVTVAAVDDVGRVGEISDVIESNYLRDRPGKLPMPSITYNSRSGELNVNWNGLVLTEYQISHYLVNVTINSSSEIIIVANRSSTNINVTPGDSVSVSVAAVDEAGRVGEYSDPGTFNNTSPSEDDVTVSVDVYNLENNLTQIILSIAVVTSTNRPPINNNTITGSIDGVTVCYNHSELYYTCPVSRVDEMQSLCLVVKAFNDIGNTIVYNNYIDISMGTPPPESDTGTGASVGAVTAAGALGGVLAIAIVIIIVLIIIILLLCCCKRDKTQPKA